MFGRRSGLALLVLCGSLTSFGQDLIALEDNERTRDMLDHFGGIMIHFKIEAPGVQMDTVYMECNDEDTFMVPNAAGEYRHEFFIKHDSSYKLIRYSKYTQSDGEIVYWTDQTYIELGDKPSRPHTPPLPETYTRPSVAMLANLAQSSSSSRLHILKNQYQLVDGYYNRENGCNRLDADPYNFPYTYSVEDCGNIINVDYGVYLTKYPSELTWAKEMTATLKRNLASHYEETKTVGNLEVQVYRYKYDGHTYLMYLIEDTDCSLDGYECYTTKISVKWE